MNKKKEKNWRETTALVTEFSYEGFMVTKNQHPQPKQEIRDFRWFQFVLYALLTVFFLGIQI